METFQGLAILGQRLGQELERDEPVQAGVFGLIHHAHAPAAQFLEDAVMRNGSAYHSSKLENRIEKSCQSAVKTQAGPPH